MNESLMNLNALHESKDSFDSFESSDKKRNCEVHTFLSFVLHNQYLFQRNIRTNLGSTKVENTSFTPTDNLLKTWVISIHSFSLFLLHIPYSAYKTTIPPSLSLEHTNRINCQSISFVISILFHYCYFIPVYSASLLI